MSQGYKQLSLLEKSNPGFMQNLYNTARSNIGETGVGLSKAGKAMLGGLKTGAKWVGKASPYAGAGITAYDAARSFQIANELENMKQLYQDIPQEAIDFYRNKGKAISAGAGVGGIGGGVLGSGVFSVPGAALGIGLGGMAGGGIYNLSQLKNKYKDYYNSPEYQKILQDYNGNLKGGTGSSTSTGSKGSNGTGGQPTTQAQAQALARQLGGNIPVANKQDTGTQQANIDAINDYVSKLQEINQPYINSLQKYMDNYNNMLDQRQRAARFWQGAASLTGNPAWANIGRQYDTLTNEANKVAIIKQIQDAQAGDINAINEVMGNLALAKELNLPPEAAFANKNLLTALTANRRQLTDLEKAQIMADIRRYGYDSAFARALQVQGMKGQNALDVARTYMGGGVAPGLNNQGLPQTPYQPLANRQQGGSNLQQAFDMYANK